MSTRRRHVPLRSCIACSNKTAKRELLRIVAKPEGGIAFDAGGKISGRGAYLCANCVGGADNIRRGRLEHKLRARIAEAQWQETVVALKEHLKAPTG